MDKQKLIYGLIWISCCMTSIFLSATMIFAGFNNLRHDSYVVLLLGFIFIPIVFFTGYKGLKSILDYIFR